MNSIVGSMMSLFWSLVMMAIIFYVFSLTFVHQAAMTIEDSGAAEDDKWLDLKEAFGSVQAGMVSLYMSCTGGDDWAKYYKSLEPVGTWSRFLFLFFIAFTQIAIMNILTGIFLENAMKCAEPDKDCRYLEKVREQAEEIKELHELCKELDVDKSGTISYQEFHRILHTEDSPLRRRFFEMGLRPFETERFFQILSATTMEQEVDIQAFVHGVTKLRGGASSLDMQALAFQGKVMHKKIEFMWNYLHEQEKRREFEL
jgi:hypothetical protein